MWAWLACAAGEPALAPPVPPAPAAPAEVVAAQDAAAPEAEAPVDPTEPPPPAAQPPPEGWVDLADHIPGIRLDIRYHTADNFTGAPLPGYAAPGAWLQRAPADALARVQADLQREGLGLIVYDAYRPLRGTLGMVAWAHRTGQVHLLDDGYIARRSGHNKGNTIDLSVVGPDGAPLDMGTPWDTLSEASHTTKATGAALDNRLRLRAAMHAHGWRNYWKEWWHFTFELPGEHPHRDVPYACWEAPEGQWKEPAGWRAAGWISPDPPPPAACAPPR